MDPELKAGDFIKVPFYIQAAKDTILLGKKVRAGDSRVEKMWCQIQRISGDKLHTRLQNESVLDPDCYGFGTKITMIEPTILDWIKE